jgi:hydrogenase nickel insertion protein HypA
MFLLKEPVMHEFSVATEIAELVKQTANGLPVKKITLAIGALSNVFTDSLLMYMEIVLPDMGMEHVEIETKQVPATFLCKCGTVYTAEKFTTACPSCNGIERTLQSGQDCTVESIEVSDD